MDGQEMDAAKTKKFQERLDRISRRRFMKMAAMGSAAAVGILGVGVTQQPEVLAAAAESDYRRCINTRSLLSGNDILPLFTTTPFISVLEAGRENLSSTRYPERLEAINTVIAALDERRDSNGNVIVRDNSPLRDFYMNDKLAGNQALRDALRIAEDYFVMPFYSFDQAARAGIRPILADGSAFLTAFGDRDISDFLTRFIEVLPSQHHVTLNNANLAYLFRTQHSQYVSPSRLFASNRCAKKVGGVWNCDNPLDSANCKLEGGQPTAGTTICEESMRGK